MITGLSARLGSSRFSTAAKKASQSTWAMERLSRSLCRRRRGDPHTVHRAARGLADRVRQSRQKGASLMGVRLFELGGRKGPAGAHDVLGLGIQLLGKREQQWLIGDHIIEDSSE